MFAGHDPEIHAILLSAGASAEALADVAFEAEAAGRSLAAVAVERGILAHDELLRAVADNRGCQCQPPPRSLSSELAARVPAAVARRYRVIPVSGTPDSITLAAADPFDASVPDELAFVLGMDVEWVVCDPAEVERLLDITYGEPSEDAVQELGDRRSPHRPPGQVTSGSDPDPNDPIVSLVDAILLQAVRDRATDIHFEPFGTCFRLRYRVDGMLYEMEPPAPNLAAAVISRLKVMADLDIAECRLPQDGRIRLNVDDREVDLRISTLPTQLGESVVLRVLDRAAVDLSLARLGMPPDVQAKVEQIARRPAGIFITSGPTGSGKTTTLYSILRTVNHEGIKILTAEDPVEYEIEGIVQVPINARVGMGFATALRAFLRQDPDKILVGEIRDWETAQTAVRAALTGHLVFATLHTNDAVGCVTRLVDLGLQRDLVAAALVAALAQRLVRKVCPECSTRYAPDPVTAAALGFREGTGHVLSRGSGCSHCHYSGHSGRLGLFELVVASDRFRQAVADGASEEALWTIAREEGARSLREEGMRALQEGRTSADEVLAHC